MRGEGGGGWRACGRRADGGARLLFPDLETSCSAWSRIGFHTFVSANSAAGRGGVRWSAREATLRARTPPAPSTLGRAPSIAAVSSAAGILGRGRVRQAKQNFPVGKGVATLSLVAKALTMSHFLLFLLQELMEKLLYTGSFYMVQTNGHHCVASLSFSKSACGCCAPTARLRRVLLRTLGPACRAWGGRRRR